MEQTSEMEETSTPAATDDYGEESPPIQESEIVEQPLPNEEVATPLEETAASPSPPENPWLHKFVTVDDIQVHYQMIGGQVEPTKAILLWHGFLSNTNSWSFVLQPLATATGRTVIAFDRPGFGYTERKFKWKENPYTFDFSISVGPALLKRLGFASAIFVGHSFGGKLVMEAMLRYTALVEAIVFVDATVYRVGLPFFVIPRSLPYPEAYHDKNLVTNVTLKEIYHSCWSDNNSQNAHMLFLKQQVKEMSTNQHQLMLSKFEKIAGKIPTLVITGKNDKILGPEFSKMLATELKGKYAEIDNCGHNPHEEKPEQFVTIVADFIKTL